MTTVGKIKFGPIPPCFGFESRKALRKIIKAKTLKQAVRIAKEALGENTNNADK